MTLILPGNIDPDSNLFNLVGTSCKYYTEESFHANFVTDNIENKFSIVHFNARSIGKNFTEITEFLNELKYTFDIIAISESWLDDKTATEFNLDGYEVINQIRLDKKGGGCSLYIRDIFKDHSA